VQRTIESLDISDSPLITEKELPMNTTSQENAKNVFVVYGRNELAKRAMYEFLRAIGLTIVEWEQAVALTKKGTPFVGEILEAAFRVSKAVVVLLTGDDEARLRSEYYSVHEPESEKIRNYSGALEWLIGPDKGDGSEPFHQKWRCLPKGNDRQIVALDALG
jgi:Predicted nucleotide-binding protein containing TIR-like domain